MNRYRRQLQLKEMGEEGQQKLRSSAVAVIGCGALGSVAAMYLAGAGVGKLIIADFDKIDISNLQRQIHYTEAEIGESKVHILRNRIAALNSEVEVETIEEYVSPYTMRTIAARVDVVVEASDNPNTKYMVSDVAASLQKNCVIGGVAQWRGQVFTQTATGKTYRDLFPECDNSGYTPMDLGGVVGPVPGVVAAMQAAETIKFLIGVKLSHTSRLMFVDTLNAVAQTIELE